MLTQTTKANVCLYIWGYTYILFSLNWDYLLTVYLLFNIQLKINVANLMLNDNVLINGVSL